MNKKNKIFLLYILSNCYFQLCFQLKNQLILHHHQFLDLMIYILLLMYLMKHYYLQHSHPR